LQKEIEDMLFTNYALEALMTDATQAGSSAVSGILRGAVAHLFISNNTPTGDDVVTDYMEANFPGYSSESITWGAAYINGNDQVENDGQTITWSCTGTPVQQTCYGVFVTDSTNTHLLYVDKFSVANVISISGNGVTYVPALVPSFASGIPQS
jgi:hypothetical protein